MNEVTTAWEGFLHWLVPATVQAGVLVVVILLLQKILGNRLGVRGRYCLWLVLLIRMAMPWTPPSRMSLYNVLPQSLRQNSRAWAQSPTRGSRAAASIERTAGVGSETSSGVSDGILPEPPRSQNKEWPVGWTVRGLSLFWLLGACALTGYTLTGSVRLWRVVRGGQLVTNRETLDLLDASRRLIGTRADVDVIVTDRLGSPALFGVFRPRLLLPRETLAQATPMELRHIFLHELAHLKRRDILVDSLASVAHILHWFNPLIALGMRRMRADRELACDAMALTLLAPAETSAYGRTVIGQIERLFASHYRPALVGLCGVRAQTKQRIAMIARFERNTPRWSVLPMLLIAILTGIGLTDGLAIGIQETWDQYARKDLPTTHTDKHTNIRRACIRNQLTGKFLTVNAKTVTCDADEPGQAGLWEYRFDVASNRPDVPVYFYSVSARRYLTCDEQKNLGLDATEPNEAARWGVRADSPKGVWIMSHNSKDGYLRLNDASDPEVASMARDMSSYWDIHSVWRIKTGDDPGSNPQWQREKIPGPD